MIKATRLQAICSRVYFLFFIKKKRQTPLPLPKHSVCNNCLFAEISLQQASKSAAVTGFVAGHLVDGVVKE